ncbi:MAG: DUF488 family protein [Caldimonas sp.]
MAGIPQALAAEVRQHPEVYDQLRELAQQGPVTLVYSAHDEIHNDAVVLRSLLLGLKTAAQSRSWTGEGNEGKT